MLEQIIKILSTNKSPKIVFNPAIKVNAKPGEAQTWIDDIMKVNNGYYLTVSTLNDNAKMALDSLNENQLKSLKLRLDFLKK